MKKFLTRNRKWFVRAALSAVAAGGLLLLGASPRAAADDNHCQQKLAKADHKVHEAVEHHGWNSSQANNARHQLNEAREYCWNQVHKWWDEDGHRWHTDRDWDEHDHDHDRDHDH